jgi:uncharacterized damage-inducible protein DinB
MGLRETVPPAFQTVWGAVRKNVEAMPDAEMDFRPEGLETRSFREIAVHMANASVTFGENVGKSQWERITAYPPDKVVRKAQVLDALHQAGERFLSGLARLTAEEESQSVRTPWGADLPQGRLVAGHVPHMFYHNGQLAIYLRMRGIKPLFLVR